MKLAIDLGIGKTQDKKHGYTEKQQFEKIQFIAGLNAILTGFGNHLYKWYSNDKNHQKDINNSWNILVVKNRIPVEKSRDVGHKSLFVENKENDIIIAAYIYFSLYNKYNDDTKISPIKGSVIALWRMKKYEGRAKSKTIATQLYFNFNSIANL